METLEDRVYNFPTKYKEGFIASEEKELLSQFSGLNMDRYYDAMRGNTCMMRDEGIITYHCDVLTALRCAIEDREITFEEWD